MGASNGRFRLGRSFVTESTLNHVRNPIKATALPGRMNRVG